MFDWIPANQTASVLLLSIVGMIGGLYITHINPRYISLPYFGGIRISGLQLIFADFTTHMIPALVVHHYIYDNKIIVIVDFFSLMFAIGLGLIYVIFNCPCRRYNITYIDCAHVLIVSFMIFNILNLFFY